MDGGIALFDRVSLLSCNRRSKTLLALCCLKAVGNGKGSHPLDDGLKQVKKHSSKAALDTNGNQKTRAPTITQSGKPWLRDVLNEINASHMPYRVPYDEMCGALGRALSPEAETAARS